MEAEPAQLVEQPLPIDWTFFDVVKDMDLP